MINNDDYVLLSNKYDTSKLLYYNFALKKFYVSEPEKINPIFLIPICAVILTRYLNLFENIQISDSISPYVYILTILAGGGLGIVTNYFYRKFHTRKYSVIAISNEEVRHYSKDTKKMLILFVPFLIFIFLLIAYSFPYMKSIRDLLTNILLIVALVIFLKDFRFNKKLTAYIELKNASKSGERK